MRNQGISLTAMHREKLNVTCTVQRMLALLQRSAIPSCVTVACSCPPLSCAARTSTSCSTCKAHTIQLMWTSSNSRSHTLRKFSQNCLSLQIALENGNLW